ncbi:MAG TPA: lysophospholipid acyltransferase family protein [Candidatus Didemnitutus sp.]|nr:lysophospholipid acyltransferase family protein [Candidatus Didemnitutus sp.]
MIARALVIGSIRILTGVRVGWRGTEPVTGQCVYFANHTSNLDGAMLWAALPKSVRNRTRPVAAHDYWTRNGVRRYLAKRVFDAVLIERKNVTVSTNPLTPMLAALDTGSSLIVFPEGGRMEGSEPGAFKGGIHHLAVHRAGLAFVPAWIDNVNRVLPKGEILPVPMLGSVTLGAPIHLEVGETREKFLGRARSALLALRA